MSEGPFTEDQIDKLRKLDQFDANGLEPASRPRSGRLCCAGSLRTVLYVRLHDVLGKLKMLYERPNAPPDLDQTTRRYLETQYHILLNWNGCYLLRGDFRWLNVMGRISSSIQLIEAFMEKASLLAAISVRRPADHFTIPAL